MLLTPPRVKLETDADLDVGVFGIATRLVRGQRARPRDAPAAQPSAGRDDDLQAARCRPSRRTRPLDEPAAGVLTRRPAARARASGTVVLGRSKDADIQIADPNVSRRHAEVRHDGGGYTVVDLDSTNGIEVDGKRVKRAAARRRDALHARIDGDRLLDRSTD